MIKIALIGNPNSGKTTLYNALTGEYKKTGNWTGVTVDKSSCAYKKDKSVLIVDLPGIYSLNASSNDEKVAVDFLRNETPDAVINVIDGTNLERSLFLTYSLIKFGIPTVLAINMCDELEKNNINIDCEKLSKAFNMPVVKISAVKRKNVYHAVDIARENKVKPRFYENERYITNKNIYEKIEETVKNVVFVKRTKLQIFTQKADSILLSKYFGLPIFFLVILGVYFLSMKLGGILGEILNGAIQESSGNLKQSFLSNGVPSWLCSLTFDAVIKGVGTVISFLPQILILFFLMSLIEESGYASRIAFLTDRIFNSIGLNGKSVIPLVLACGCTVSGLMATRTIENQNERRLTAFLVPFMPCGAKTAVFAFLSYHLFSGSALCATSTYFLSIICVAVFGKLLIKNKDFGNKNGVFFLEMPTLMMPPIYDVFRSLWEKTKDFILKAGSVIFLVSVGLWLMKSFGFNGYTTDIKQSFLYFLGDILKYVFYPLGFGNVEASVSLLSGVLAKEATVETLEILCVDVQSIFNNGFSAYAYMVFILLSPPCIAALSVAKKELGKKWFLRLLFFEFSVAYGVALLINVFGFLYFKSGGLLLSIVAGIIILTGIIFSLKKIRKPCCKNCSACKKVSLCRKK